MTELVDPRHDAAHLDADVEEWLFTCWWPPGGGGEAIGVISGYRVHRATPHGHAWYWAAVVRPGHPLLHVTDWEVPPRSDPLLIKGVGLWAEHTIDAPMEQWSVANETYAAALDDPDDALGRAYGSPTAVAFDLEWYATAAARWLDDPADSRGDDDGAGDAAGYGQSGVVHGAIELGGSAPIELREVPARRWHRWGRALAPVRVPVAEDAAGDRAPFAYPDGSRSEWALTPDGWREATAAPQRGGGSAGGSPVPAGSS